MDVSGVPLQICQLEGKFRESEGKTYLGEGFSTVFLFAGVQAESIVDSLVLLQRYELEKSLVANGTNNFRLKIVGKKDLPLKGPVKLVGPLVFVECFFGAKGALARFAFEEHCQF